MSPNLPLAGKRIILAVPTGSTDYDDYIKCKGANVSKTRAVSGISTRLHGRGAHVIVITTQPDFNGQPVTKIARDIRRSTSLNLYAKNIPIIAMSETIRGPGPIRSAIIDNLHWIRPNPSGDMMTKIIEQVANAERMTVAEVREKKLPTHDPNGLAQLLPKANQGSAPTATA